jgi:hypothetical protein
MTRRSLAAVPTLLLALALCAPVQAQGRPHRVWVAAGLGGGGAHGGAGGPGVMGQLVYERAPHHFSLRGVATMGDPGGSGDGFGEFGVLYGRFAAGGIAYAGAAAGLSFVHLDRCGDRYDPCSTVGIPLTGQVALTPFDVIGIGLQLYANINPKAPFAGMFITVPLGWMP